MATIDDKVVAMSFESSKFESGVSKSLSAIEKLKAALQFKDAGKGMIEVGNAAHQVDLGHIAKGVDEVSSRLSALRLAAIAVFADIAKKAVAAGTNLVKAFTIEPLKAGFQEYSTQLNSVQTILANTQASGATLKDVNKALQELNNYSDKTIYNFGQMARNIGTFTAAGVDLKTATMSIKGIANLAALSGSNAEQASTAMYQLSQAISSGSVKLMDWNSVVNAGMGGTVFQRALALTGEHMGKLKEGTVQLVGPMKNVKIAGESFRNSLSAPGKDGWLTGDVLTKTLKMFTSDMTDAELAADGWNKKEIKAIQTQAKSAMLAATNVKTLQQVLAVAKETAGSGWAKTWQIVFGDFGEAKKTFTDLSNAINGMLIDSARARNNLLADWKALGGRKILINSIKTAFENLSAVVKPIKQAFRDIFPAMTGKNLLELTKQFNRFTRMLKPSEETIHNLRRTFRGLFAILDIGKQIISGIFGVFKTLFSTMSQGSGGFLEFTASIGDWLVKLDKALKEGGQLNAFFEGLGKVLVAPIKALQYLASLLSGSAGESMGKMTKSLTPLQKGFRQLGEVLSQVFDKLNELSGIFEPVLKAVVDLIAQLPTLLGKALSNMSFEPILAAVRVGLLGGLFVLFKRFLGKGAAIDQLTKGFVGGLTGQFKGMTSGVTNSLGALTNALVGLQQSLKAKVLKDIAIAVTLLAASMVILSFVDPKKLDSAISAITVGFAQLLGAMTILGNITKNLGFIKMPVIATTLVILAGAIFVLSASVAALSLLSWEQLAKGLTAVTILLGALSIAVVPLSAGSFGLVKAGIGITAIAVALNILALAVLAFGKMDLMTLGKGMASIGIGLFILGTYVALLPSGISMIAQGAGLIAIAVALNILSLAVLSLGSMSLETLGKGLGAIGISLGIIAGAMHLMPKTMALQAAGLILVAAALIGISTAVKIMGGMSMFEIAKGIGGLAYSLALLTVALIAMSGSLSGAAALGVAAAAIAILVPSLILLGSQSIKVIAAGLITLALAFGVIVAAGILLEAAAPGLLAFGGAVLLIGAGLALAGAGIFLAAAGLGALIGAFILAVKIIPDALVELQRSLVENAKLLVLGILEIVKAFADTAPQFVDAIVKILTSVLDAIIQLIPQIEKIVTVLLETLIRILDQQQGPIIEAVLSLIMALLTGIKDHIGEITETVLLIVANFLSAIAANIGKIAKAGADVVIALIKGIAGNYARIVTAALTVIVKFLNGIANNIGKIVTAGGNIITKFLKGISNNIRKVAAAATDVVVAFINGVGNAGPRIVTAATNAIIKFINALSKNGVKLANAGLQAVIDFLNGVAKAIEDHDHEMRDAGQRLGKALVMGMIGGLVAWAPELKRKAEQLAGDTVGWIRKKTHTDSPSKETYKIGVGLAQGLALGMTDSDDANKAAIAMGNGVIASTKGIFQITSPSKVMAKIGRYVAAGLAEGIKAGTEEDVKQSFANINAFINQSLAEAKRARAEARSMKKEEEGKKPEDRTKGAIAKATAEIKKQNTAIRELTAAHNRFNGVLKEQRAELLAEAKKYTEITAKIEKVKEVIQEFKDQYSALPEIELTGKKGEALSGAEQLKRYTASLTAQVAAVKKYNESLQKLRALGLDDKTYNMLLEEGTSGQEFADALIAGGKPAVDSIKSLDTDLDTASGTLGENAAANLYNAGIKAAEGLVAGLESEKKNIQTLMNTIADTMVERIKKKLGIKSPSKAFAEIGKLSMKGMAKGFSDSSKVTKAIDQTASDALTAMQKSMSDISDAVNDELDANPVITPVLDLTQVRSEAQKMAALKDAIASDVSLRQASTISAEQALTQTEKDMAMAAGTAVKFEQNNYSPAALTNIEIYRQTKNQLSALKTALALT